MAILAFFLALNDPEQAEYALYLAYSACDASNREDFEAFVIDLLTKILHVESMVDTEVQHLLGGIIYGLEKVMLDENFSLTYGKMEYIMGATLNPN